MLLVILPKVYVVLRLVIYGIHVTVAKWCRRRRDASVELILSVVSERIVLCKEALLLKAVVEVDLVDQLDGVAHLVLHASKVLLLQHFRVIMNSIIVFHDFFVEGQSLFKLLIDFVCKCPDILDLVWDWALSVVDSFLDGYDSFSSQVELDASQSESVVRIRPIFLHFYGLLELLLSLARLVILLVVAGQIEDGWCVLRVELESLLVAIQSGGQRFVVLVEHNTLVIPVLRVQVRVEALATIGETHARSFDPLLGCLVL